MSHADVVVVPGLIAEGAHREAAAVLDRSLLVYAVLRTGGDLRVLGPARCLARGIGPNAGRPLVGRQRATRIRAMHRLNTGVVGGRVDQRCDRQSRRRHANGEAIRVGPESADSA